MRTQLAHVSRTEGTSPRCEAELRDAIARQVLGYAPAFSWRELF